MAFRGLVPPDAQPAIRSLALVVSTETAPAGGSVQFKVFASTPSQIASGTIAMSFDTAVLGAFTNVTVFSATGDAAGYVNVDGNQLTAIFTSASGSIGQLPGLPILTVSMPVLAGLQQGTSTTVTIDVSNSSLNDVNGNSDSVAVKPATFRVGGSLYVASVTPAGGLLPAGSAVQIGGAGFDASTAVTWDGVDLASIQVLGAGQITVTLGAPTELTGKHLRLTNSAGEQVDFFPALSSSPADGPSNLWPLVPLPTYQIVQWNFPMGTALSEESWALLNSTPSPVSVTFLAGVENFFQPTYTATVPPGALFFPFTYQVLGTGSAAPNALFMAASAPIRMLAVESDVAAPPDTYKTYTFPPLYNGDLSGVYGLGLGPNHPVEWDWEIGGAQPERVIETPVLSYTSVPTNCQLAVTTTAAWLNVAVAQCASITLTPNVTGLARGTYSGSFTTIVTLPSYVSFASPLLITTPVVLKVSSAPFIMIDGSSGGPWTVAPGAPPPPPMIVQLSPEYGSFGPAPVQASVSTSSGGNWLSITSSSGGVPGTVTLAANPAGLGLGVYLGQLTVQTAANTVTTPFELVVATPANTTPASISFVAEAGSAEPQYPVYATLIQGSAAAVSVQTQSGGNWLTAMLAPPSGAAANFNPAGLSPGTYQGAVTITTSTGTQVQVPVTLTLTAPPAAITVAPATLVLTGSPGQTVTGTFNVTSPGTSGFFAFSGNVEIVPRSSTLSLSVVSAPLLADTPFLYVTPASVTPAVVQVQGPAPQQPGTYYASFEVTWTGGSVTVPVRLDVTPTPALPPILGALVSTASEVSGAISPGEIISLFGIGLGAGPTEFSLDAAGKVPSVLNGTQVLINGQPVPLLYASGNQVNAIVPYEVGTSGSATVQVVASGASSQPWGMPVAVAAPGVFAVGSVGVGQAAALNQDNSPNSASNPAPRGSVVQFFGTGEGLTSPANVTGGVTPGSGNSTTLPVTVMIGGIGAVVTYQGSAPAEVSGVMQVNAIIPAGVTPGGAVPVVIQVGNQKSQSGMTIAVR
jgi:uncharacterized protein (TIGR03437 family)